MPAIEPKAPAGISFEWNEKRRDEMSEAPAQAAPKETKAQRMERLKTCGRTWAARFISGSSIATAWDGGTSNSTTSGSLHKEKPNVPALRQPTTADAFAHEGLPPVEAARAMTVPRRILGSRYSRGSPTSSSRLPSPLTTGAGSGWPRPTRTQSTFPRLRRRTAS